MPRVMTLAQPPAVRPSPLYSEMRMPRIVGMLRRRFRAVGVVALLGLAGAVGYLYVTVPQYTAQAMLALGSGDTRLGADGRFSSAPAPTDLSTIRTHVEILESWSMSAHAVEKLGLVEKPSRSEQSSILTVATVWVSEVPKLWTTAAWRPPVPPQTMTTTSLGSGVR